MRLIDELLELIDVHFKDVDWDNYDRRSLAFSKALEQLLVDRGISLSQLIDCLIDWSEAGSANTFEGYALKLVGSVLKDPVIFQQRIVP
jgi:hypothetical protein